MKILKIRYSVPHIEIESLLGLQHVLASSGDLDSNAEPMDMLDDDFANWDGVI